MDWHVLLRRCPSHSITAMGDLAQRSAPAGAHGWADVLAPNLGSRWTYRALTVNYRTPAEIMALAAAVLAEFAPDRQPPESVRAAGEDPWQRTVPATDLAAEVRKAVEAEVAQLGRGTLAVIAADVDGLAGLPAEVRTPVSAKVSSSTPS
jgi:DNA helicase IV